MKVETLRVTPISRESWDAVALTDRESATVRAAARILREAIARVGKGARAYNPDLPEDPHEAALEALGDDDPLPSASASLDETIDHGHVPGVGIAFEVPGSRRCDR